MNVLSIVIAVILLGFALKGMSDGLVKTVCSFFIIFIAVLVTQVATPQVSSLIRDNETIVSWVEEQVNNVLFSQDEEEKKDSGETVIEKLLVPKIVKQQLLKDNNQENYETLGVTGVNEYISLYIAYSVINCVTYIIVFLLALALLKVIVNVLNIVTKLPVINTLNKLGGFGVGLVQGLIITWVIFIVFILLANTKLGVQINSQINESPWLLYLYDNNLILKAISSITKGLL